MTLVVLGVVTGIYLLRQLPVTVRVAQPERNVSIGVFGLGTVEARVLSEVGFEVGAALIQLNADHGDRVRRGAILARLHSEEQAARTARAKAGVVSAQAALNVTRAVVQKARAVLHQRQQTNHRIQRLVAQRAVSDEVAEDAQLNEDVAAAELAIAASEIEVSSARLTDASADLEYESVMLDHHVLRAPYDALVVKRHRELGSVLHAGDPVFTLVDPTTVWALAYVDEAQAGRLHVGQQAEVRLRSSSSVPMNGHVARIGIESDRVNEERLVYIVCDECSANFHLGEQAEIVINTATLEHAVLVPEAVFAEFDGIRGVIWVVDDGRLRLQTVHVGARTLDGRLEIVDGLTQGVLPLTALSGGLREGRRVRIEAAASP